VKKRTVLILLLGYFGLIFLLLLGLGYYWYRYKEAPQQPIAFSHRIHVSRVALPCNFCHTYADKSTSPGIPPVQKCENCHRTIATDRPEIKKLLQYWQNKEPISWIRVHSLPAFVYFSHKRHVKQGIDCSVCHGEVKVMDRIRQVRSLKMGWCVSCHRANNAPTDCLTCHK